MSQRELLSVKDVAVRLDVHEQTVRTLIREGRLSAVRVGKLVRISVGSLSDFYRANQYQRRAML